MLIFYWRQQILYLIQNKKQIYWKKESNKTTCFDNGNFDLPFPCLEIIIGAQFEYTEQQ